MTPEQEAILGVVSEGVRHDLADGDWLIPGVSCQVVQISPRSSTRRAPVQGEIPRTP